MYKNIYDTPEEIEVSFSVSDTSLYRLPLGRMFTTYEIWTGAGKTGTQLIDNTDFIAGGTSARAGEIKGESVYTGFQITNAGYHSTTLYATIYWVGTLGNTDTIFRDVGELKRFATYKDRTASRLLPFAFDNAVSKADYADLYDEVGDVFEAMHVAAGDDASAADEFYPTPIPGYYERTGLPDSGIIDSTSDVNVSTNKITVDTAFYTGALRHHGADTAGAPVRLKLISGSFPTVSGTALNETDNYYLNFSTSPDIYLYRTEADAIAGTNLVDITATATGTFRLTQEGVEIGDTLQGHKHQSDPLSDATASGESRFMIGGSGAARTATTTGPVSDTVNGTPRTSNETRPSTLYEFGYIRY